MKCKLTKRLQVSKGHPFMAPLSWMEVGYVYESPESYKLVRLGCAVPEDDECRLAAGMTDVQILRAQKHQVAVAAGIQPEDYDAFFGGEMTGYDPKGRKIPGENADEEDVEEYEELTEEDLDNE